MSAATATAEKEPVVSEVRITDPYVVSLVTEEQTRTGEKSLARAAGRLISERIAIREAKGELMTAATASPVAAR